MLDWLADKHGLDAARPTNASNAPSTRPMRMASGRWIPAASTADITSGRWHLAVIQESCKT
jgi:hypothetical protein